MHFALLTNSRLSIENSAISSVIGVKSSCLTSTCNSVGHISLDWLPKGKPVTFTFLHCHELSQLNSGWNLVRLLLMDLNAVHLPDVVMSLSSITHGSHMTFGQQAAPFVNTVRQNTGHIKATEVSQPVRPAQSRRCEMVLNIWHTCVVCTQQPPHSRVLTPAGARGLVNFADKLMKMSCTTWMPVRSAHPPPGF